MRLRMPGVFARSGLLERIRLTPEGVDLAANIRLARSLGSMLHDASEHDAHEPAGVQALPRIIEAATRAGLPLVTVDELVESGPDV